jgi:hypothetical protein
MLHLYYIIGDLSTVPIEKISTLLHQIFQKTDDEKVKHHIIKTLANLSEEGLFNIQLTYRMTISAQWLIL